MTIEFGKKWPVAAIVTKEQRADGMDGVTEEECKQALERAEKALIRAQQDEAETLRFAKELTDQLRAAMKAAGFKGKE